jgi:hypothetical protein
MCSSSLITGNYSLGLNGQTCTGTVNPSANHQPYDSTFPGGAAPDYLANGCNTPLPPLQKQSAGTNAVIVSGAGTLVSAANGITAMTAPNPIMVVGGHVNFTAANTTCTSPLPANCTVSLNEEEIDFAPISGNVFGGAHNLMLGRVFLDQPVVTGSGLLMAPQPPVAPNPTFLFFVPPATLFDGNGVGDTTSLLGASFRSDTFAPATLDVVTGQLTVDFDISEVINGDPAELTGAVITDQVIELPPTVTAAPTVTATASGASCTANVTLTASAASPLNLPLSVSFAVSPPGLSAPANAQGSATFSLGAGTHSVSILAVDTNGGSATATEVVTVADETVPTFTNVPGPETLQGCAASGSGAVPVTSPTAVDACGGASAGVTGSVVEFNGATVSIPIVNGTVNVPTGSGTLQFVATGANGKTSTVSVPLTVLASSTLYGTQGITVDDGAIVNGTLYSGAHGQLLLQNDAHVGSVFSLSPIVLQDRVHAPSIDGNAGITLGHSDVIGSSSTATPTLPAFPSEPVTFTGTQAITVNPAVEGGDVVTLAPGQYGAVAVFSRGKLILSAGNYEFTSLDLEPQGQMVVPSSTAETARVFVENVVAYRGTTNVATTSSSPPPAPLFLVDTGTATLTIGSAFIGTIVAPNATLALQSLNNTGVYTGEFFAKQITLSPNTTLNSEPFTCQP